MLQDCGIVSNLRTKIVAGDHRLFVAEHMYQPNHIANELKLRVILDVRRRPDQKHQAPIHPGEPRARRLYRHQHFACACQWPRLKGASGGKTIHRMQAPDQRFENGRPIGREFSRLSAPLALNETHTSSPAPNWRYITRSKLPPKSQKADRFPRYYFRRFELTTR